MIEKYAPLSSDSEKFDGFLTESSTSRVLMSQARIIKTDRGHFNEYYAFDKSRFYHPFKNGNSMSYVIEGWHHTKLVKDNELVHDFGRVGEGMTSYYPEELRCLAGTDGVFEDYEVCTGTRWVCGRVYPDVQYPLNQNVLTGPDEFSIPTGVTSLVNFIDAETNHGSGTFMMWSQGSTDEVPVELYSGTAWQVIASA